MKQGWITIPLREAIGPQGLFADGDWVESKDQDANGDVRLIQLADIGDGTFINKSSRFMTASKAAQLRCTYLCAGDVLVARMADPIGRTCVFPIMMQKCVTVVDVCIMRPTNELADPRWLMHGINAPQSRRAIELAASGTTRNRISRSNLGELSFPIPPHNEQRRIVDKLEALQARSRKAREALDEVPALLEKLRQSILAAAFRGDLTKDWRAKNPDVEPAEKLLQRIRAERRKKWEETELAKLKAKGKPPTDDRWKAKYEEPTPADAGQLSELPKDWCWASVEELCPLDAPAVYGIILPGDDVQDGVPYLRPIDIREDGTIDFSSVKRTSAEIAAQHARASLRAGDLVLSIVGTIGKVVIVPPELDGGNITQSSIRIRPPEWLSSEYLRLALLSPTLTHQYDRFRFGNAVQRLNVEHVRRLAIPLAPMAETPFLVSATKRSLRKIPAAAISAALEGLERLSKSVLSKAFRGELVPQDPNDEPAAVMLARLKAEAAAAAPDSAQKSSKRTRKERSPKP